MNVLVTYGSGFIGSNVIKYIFEKYSNFLIFKLDPYCSSIENINKEIRESDRYKIFKDNLLSDDRDSYYLICNILTRYSIDLVLHFDDESETNNLVEQTPQYTQDNVLGTRTLLEACRKYGKLSKFIYISSEAPSSIPLVQSYHDSFKLPIIIARCNNIYGPNQCPEKIIPKFIQQVANNEKIIIHGDGSNAISFLHVNDVCSALDIIIQKGQIGELYDIKNDEQHEIKVLELAQMLIKYMKDTEHYHEWIEYIEDSQFNEKNNYINNEDLKNLGWEIKTKFEEGLYSLFKKYYKNIPIDFDPIEYQILNDDLINLSYLDVAQHYEIQGYTENRITKFDYNLDVFVYCCGKAGSSTLYKTLMNNNFKCIHTHSSDYYINHTCFAKFEPDVFNLIQECSRDKNIYIIDSYRTPIERRLSSFFQHLTNEELEYTYDKIENMIDHVIYEIEDYTSINEVLDHFDLPRFSTFDFNKKYNLLKYKNINFIKLRFQDINEWEHILTDIFKKPIKIHKENISDSKIYSNLYKEIKNKYKIPEYMIDYIKNDTESKIYLSEEEFNNYINYWNTRVK